VTARAATFGVFFLNGAMIGTWVGQIPFVQERLDVSKSTIGLALLCMAGGAMIAMPLTGQVLDRRSSATVTRVAALVYLPLLALPVFALVRRVLRPVLAVDPVQRMRRRAGAQPSPAGPLGLRGLEVNR
jgi:predicted MFS family arabinose efflux permease